MAHFSEEAASKLIEMTAQTAVPLVKQQTPKHRHSLHATNVNHLHITPEDLEKLKIHSKGGKSVSFPLKIKRK